MLNIPANNNSYKYKNTLLMQNGAVLKNEEKQTPNSAVTINQQPTKDEFTPAQGILPAVNERRMRNLINIIPNSYADELGSVAILITAITIGKGRFTQLTRKIAEMGKNNDSLTKTVEQLKRNITDLINRNNSLSAQDVENIINKKGLINAADVDTKIASATASIAGSIGELTEKVKIKPQTIISQKANFPTEFVTVNGKTFEVATILPGSKISGEKMETLYQQLQTEAAKRIIGVRGDITSALPQKGNVAFVTSEYRGFASTGGLAIVPKELAENYAKIFAKAQDQEFSTTLYMPLYRGKIDANNYREVFYSNNGTAKIVDKQEGKADTLVAELKEICSFNSKIYTDTQRTEETVHVLSGTQYVNLDDPSQYISKLSQENQNSINALKNGEKIKIGNIEYTKTDDKINARTLINTIFLDNGNQGKFHLNIAAGKESNIYNDNPLAAGETERFLYFNRFLYDLFAGKANNSSISAPDLIMGNDWHTGGLTALCKMLAPVDAAYGDINPELGKKLYNIPQITILHNAGLAGEAYHSHNKLLNILFGDKTATILQNAYMNLSLKNNSKTNLPQALWNGLLHGTGDGVAISPQMMAISYTDILVPVSKGYAKEIATDQTYAVGKLSIYAARARQGVYSDPKIIQKIVNANNITLGQTDDIARPTLIGITNGCDIGNNTLTQKSIDNIEDGIKGVSRFLQTYPDGQDVLTWHNGNKAAGINVLKRDLNIAKQSNGTNNPMKILNPETVDLSDITVDTPIITSAGRISGQKGIDIWAQSIIEFAKEYKGENPPVFYLQGITQSADDQKLINAFMHAKEEVSKINPKMGQRMLYAALFKEKGRFDMAKIFSDFSVMPSWFEPCGLSHKEMTLFSGSIPIVNKTGGLADGFEEGKNIFISQFNPDRSKIQGNASNFAKAMLDAVNCYQQTPEKYKEMVNSAFNLRFDWKKENGPLAEYLNLGKILGVFSESTAATKLD